MSEEPVQNPEASELPRGTTAVPFWRQPAIAPRLVVTTVLGGIGWLAYYLDTQAPAGLLMSWGITLSDAWIVPIAAALGAVAFFAVSASVGRRMRVLLFINRALWIFGRGERRMGVLRLPDKRGTAQHWNALLAWAEEKAEVEEAAALLQARSNGGSSAAERASDGLWHGVMIVDERQVIRYANGAAAVFLRQRRDALPGVDVRRVIEESEVLGAIARASETGSRQKRVFDVGDATTPDSSVLRFSVRSIGQKADRATLIVIEDVTQQRIADAVQHAFVAQATHELRTPLTNMRLYVEQLLGDDLTAEERGTALNVVNQEIARLDKTVGDMLSIAEVQAGGLSAKRGDVRIQQIFDQLRDDYAESARSKGLTLSFNLPPKFPVIQGDREKLMIVLHNLMGNAVKYTPSGGTVRVTVREEGDRLVTEVSDTGIGISEEDAEHVFDRFSRGQDPRALEQTGTGLGLALARDIARLHDGDITLQSEVDQGSTFSFWLPTGVHTPAKAA